MTPQLKRNNRESLQCFQIQSIKPLDICTFTHRNRRKQSDTTKRKRDTS